MLPITPKGARRWLRFSATRKGLFGGSKPWLAVFGAMKAKDQFNKVSKGGVAPVAFRQSLKHGHWFEIVHEDPPATRREKRTAKKTAKKAERLRVEAEAQPTRRRIRRATRAGVKAVKANEKVGPRRATVTALQLADSSLTKRQRKKRDAAHSAPLADLETLDRRRQR